MKKRFLCLILLFGIFVFLVSQRKGEIKLNINNDIDFSIVLSDIYCLDDILLLKEKLNDDKMTINEFIKEYNVKYFRKTIQGYYTFFKIDSGSKAFVFFDNDLLFIDILVLDTFETKNDFDDIIIGESNIEMVKDNHKNYILFPWSVTTSLGYITKDGIVIINSLNKSKELKVDSIDFYENDKLLELYINKQIINIPYIYSIDKQ